MCCGDIESISEKLKRLKKEYETTGEDIYFYSALGWGSISTVRGESFEFVYKKKIEPKIEDGAICLHISHFNGSTNIKDYEIIPPSERIKNTALLGDNSDAKSAIAR